MTFEEELVQAENEYIAVIGNYLIERAKTDQAVAGNLKKENKSLKRCFQFIIDEARKMQKGNCAMIKDDIVFGWAVHYYDEDNLSIDEVRKTTVTQKKKTEEVIKNSNVEKKTVAVDKPKAKVNKGQISIGDQLSLF